MSPTKKALVIGYTGQDGTFLTKLLLEKGYKVFGLVRRISTEPPRRVRGKFDFSEYIDDGMLELVEGDLLSVDSLIRILNQHRPDEIYNLAAQSHVGISFKQPEFTIEANFMGVVNLITAVESVGQYGPERYQSTVRIYQASTSEMFGDVALQDGQQMSESTPLRPNSPYAIAKAAAHFYCRMKREQGLFISCGILFNHESEIRGGDFVTQKIAREVARIDAEYQNLETIRPLQLGNMDAMRDWGYAGDYVAAMWLMLQEEQADDYVVGTGESHSVREFVQEAFSEIGKVVEWSGEGPDEQGRINGELVVAVDPQFYRPNDVNFLNGDSHKVRELGWKPEHTFQDIVRLMVNAAREARHETQE